MKLNYSILELQHLCVFAETKCETWSLLMPPKIDWTYTSHLLWWNYIICNSGISECNFYSSIRFTVFVIS